jgi:hypothetical protein
MREEGLLFEDRYTASIVSVIKTHSCLAIKQEKKENTIESPQMRQLTSYQELYKLQRIKAIDPL